MNHLTIYVTLIVFIQCILNVSGQDLIRIDYECLDQSLIFDSANQSVYHISCLDGTSLIDTLETPCSEGFYEEDGVNIKAWYYFDQHADGNTDVHFDHMSIIEDSDSGERSFVLNRSTLWFYFPGLSEEVERISFEVKDLSGQGINFGTSLGQSPTFYSNLSELSAAGLPGLSIEYSNETLFITGSPERIFIGGDHLQVSAMLINRVLTNVDEIGDPGFKVFPNPVTTELFLSRDQNLHSTVSITDMRGKTIRRLEWTGTKSAIQLLNLSAGIYLLTVRDENGMTGYRLFVKQ